MNVTPLLPDAPQAPAPMGAPGGAGFGALLQSAGDALERAGEAERAFVAHRGGLLEMVVERASAGIMLQAAATAAQRTTQAVATILGMQV